MSKQNLKVYRIQFITQVRQMVFKVKFPCQVKMIWKRSNQTAQTTLVPVQNGIVNFNQTLKMYVNMYYDTTSNRFVQKKCMYSFLIITQKGQKSAGSITYDLSQFFNKRIYEIQQQFPLQKCPLPDTKIKMKIYYQQSTQTGYDSMSRISTSQQLDISNVSMDINQLHQHGGIGTSENKTNSQVKVNNSTSTLTQQNKSKKSQSDTTSKGKSSQKQQQKYGQGQGQNNLDLLNQSDLGTNIQIQNGNGNDNGKSQKITENIQALNKITGKINDFVSRCSGNIKNQIDNLKHKNKVLEESVNTSKFQIEKLQKQKQENILTIDELKKQINDNKIDFQSQLKKQKNNSQDLLHKYEQSQKLCQQMEKSMEEKGSSQSSYLVQLKSGFQQSQKKYKQKIQELHDEIDGQKKQKNQFLDKISKLQATIKQLKENLSHSQERNNSYQMKESQREKQLSDLRRKLQNVYEDVVKNLGIFGQ